MQKEIVLEVQKKCKADTLKVFCLAGGGGRGGAH